MNMTTSKTKDIFYELVQLMKWEENRRFDEMAMFLGWMIHKICPFHTKHGYDAILIGTAGEGVNHKHYLGWNVSDGLPDEDITVKELTERIKDPEIKKKLEEIFHLSQEFLIKPMMKIMFENEAMYQSQINKYLNMDNLDGSKQKGWITAELFQRLCSQGVMEKIKIGTHVHHIKKKQHMNYQPPIFVMPTRIGFSGGHKTTLIILQQLIVTHIFFRDDVWKIRNEHKNPDKHGFKRHMRYDIALFKNGKLWGLIEFDGKQHYEYTPHYHRQGIEQFKKLQQKDRIKDDDALKLCGGKKCLRMGPKYGGHTGEQEIKEKITNWLQ
jgi:hypothetical protein